MTRVVQRNLTRRSLVRIRVARVAQIRAVMLARKAVAVVAAGANGITHLSQAALLLRTLAETSVEGRMKIRTGAVHTVVKGMPIMTSARICGMTTASLQSWPGVRIVVPVRQLKTIVSILKSTMEGWQSLPSIR